MDRVDGKEKESDDSHSETVALQKALNNDELLPRILSFLTLSELLDHMRVRCCPALSWK